MQSIDDLDDLTHYFQKLKLRKEFPIIFKTTRPYISVEQLKIEQDFKPIVRSELNDLVKKLAIEEPLTDLLKMLD